MDLGMICRLSRGPLSRVRVGLGEIFMTPYPYPLTPYPLTRTGLCTHEHHYVWQ